jgi:hypothetical protein
MSCTVITIKRTTACRRRDQMKYPIIGWTSTNDSKAASTKYNDLSGGSVLEFRLAECSGITMHVDGHFLFCIVLFACVLAS